MKAARKRSTSALARAYLKAHAAAKCGELLKQPLLARMVEEGLASVEVPGVGAVVYTAATSQNVVDSEATRALGAALVARLRALGETVDDFAFPRKDKPVSACLNVKAAPKPRQAAS